MLRLKLCLVLLAIPLTIYPQSAESDSQAELIRALRERIAGEVHYLPVVL
jgi:hypothetical protein